MPILPEIPTPPRKLACVWFNFDRMVRTKGGLENGEMSLSKGHFKHSWSPKQRQVLQDGQSTEPIGKILDTMVDRNPPQQTRPARQSAQ